MKNTLLEAVEYQYQDAPLGRWRRFGYETGQVFEEFTSYKKIGGWPLVHYTHGVCPETGRRIVARGVVAIGRRAVGGIAIGQASMGFIAIGQLAIGLVFGLGQLSTGVAAIGQAAIGVGLGIGQFTTGYIAIGQFALGKYVLAMRGVGEHVWDMKTKSEVAIEFFKSLTSW